jgi:hypothetical protein
MSQVQHGGIELGIIIASTGVKTLVGRVKSTGAIGGTVGSGTTTGRGVGAGVGIGVGVGVGVD